MLSSVLLSGLGCGSAYKNPYLTLIPEDDYYSYIRQNTDQKELYDGFMNILKVSATMHTSSVARAQLDQNARIYQWNPDQYSNEKAKIETDLSKSTKFFLSLFVPERKHDDLNKGTTKWKIFYDVGGRRYEGKATKVKILLSEAQTLYPHHTRWQTPYILTFPIPTSIAEAGPGKLTLTGPVTSVTLEYNANLNKK